MTQRVKVAEYGFGFAVTPEALDEYARGRAAAEARVDAEERACGAGEHTVECGHVLSLEDKVDAILARLERLEKALKAHGVGMWGNPE